MSKLILRNESGLEFTDISSEAVRTYYFPNGETVTIREPQWLNVSRTGGHRLLDGYGNSHYIPWGWVQLTWSVREGAPHFVK